MDKKLGLGISLVGIVILHACSFSSTNSSSSLTNPTYSSGQKTTFPQFSGVLFAGIETQLIEPISKQQRQKILSATINPTTNAGRDPFAALPNTLPPPAAPAYEPTEYAPLAPEIPPPPPRVARSVPSAKPRPYTPPAPPPALEAEKITVSGALEIGGKSYAIVSVPGESGSQYVTEGQRVADSKVLVKRIDLSDRPQVILQQNNAEYTHPLDKS